MVGVVQDDLGGHSGLCGPFDAERAAGVEVPVSLRKVAARDLYPYAGPGFEDVSGRAEAILYSYTSSGVIGVGRLRDSR